MRRRIATVLAFVAVATIGATIVLVVLQGQQAPAVKDLIDELSLEPSEATSLQSRAEIAGVDSPMVLVFVATGEPTDRARSLAARLKLDPTHVLFDTASEHAINEFLEVQADSAVIVASGESRGRLIRILVLHKTPPRIAVVVTPGAADW